MSETWLISDTHFGHANIGRYCSRPEGWEELIWKNLEAVPAGATLIHLGDVALLPRRELAGVMSRLPGREKVLVEGNHDKRSRIRSVPGWSKVVRYGDLLEVQPGDLDTHSPRIVACHRPTDFPDPLADIFLFGHVHDTRPMWEWDRFGYLWVNLCVERWNYKPVPLSFILDVWSSPHVTWRNPS